MEKMMESTPVQNTEIKYNAKLNGDGYTFRWGNSVKLYLSPFWKVVYSVGN